MCIVATRKPPQPAAAGPVVVVNGDSGRRAATGVRRVTQPRHVTPVTPFSLLAPGRADYLLH